MAEELSDKSESLNVQNDTTQKVSQPSVSDNDESIIADKRLDQRISKIVNSVFTARAEKLVRAEQLDELKQSFVGPTSKESKKDSKEETVSKAEFLALQQKFQEKVKQEEQFASQKKDSDLRDTVKQQLKSLGVQDHLIKAAMITLIDADKSIGYDAEDKIVFKSSELGETELGLGLRQWAKTDEGKAFLTPKKVVGSGDKNLKGSIDKSNKMSDQQLANLLFKR